MKYTTFVKKHRKKGKSMKEIGKLWQKQKSSKSSKSRGSYTDREKISKDTWLIPIDQGVMTFNEDDRTISLDLTKRDFTLVAKRMKKKTKVKEVTVDPNLVDAVGFSSYRTLRLGRYLELTDTAER